MIFDDFTTSSHWVDFDFKIKSSAMKLLKPNNNRVIFRYVYHLIKNNTYKPETHSRQWIEKYSNFKVPVPTLEQQQRIVDILDKFDSLTTDISEGLPAEIKALHQQYEYYRDKLLTFKEKTIA